MTKHRHAHVRPAACHDGLSDLGRLAEGWVAVPYVVGRRLGVIGAMMRDPLAGDYRELHAMVAEKFEAAALGALSILRDGHAIGAELLRLPASPVDAIGVSMRIGCRAAAAGVRALAPFQMRAIANAERLRSGRRA